MTAADAITPLYPLLNAGDESDLIWWTASELYQWCGAAAAALARRSGAFLGRDEYAVSSGATSVPLGDSFVSAVRADYAGIALRPANVPEIDAKDDDWTATTATAPTHALYDVQGLKSLTLYPSPTVAATLGVVRHGYPAIVDGSTAVPGPQVLADYLGYSVLAEARRKRGDAAMPEVAAHLAARCALYEKIFGSYWGDAQ